MPMRGVTKTASLNVTVNPIEVAVPVQNGLPVYDGTAKDTLLDRL